MGTMVGGMVLLLVLVAPCSGQEVPVELAEQVYYVTWQQVLSGFVYGVGLGLLVKALNRS